MPLYDIMCGPGKRYPKTGITEYITCTRTKYQGVPECPCCTRVQILSPCFRMLLAWDGCSSYTQVFFLTTEWNECMLYRIYVCTSMYSLSGKQLVLWFLKTGVVFGKQHQFIDFSLGVLLVWLPVPPISTALGVILRKKPRCDIRTPKLTSDSRAFEYWLGFSS